MKLYQQFLLNHSILETSDKNYETLIELGKNNYESQQFSEAINATLEAKEIDPDKPELYELLGRCYFASGDFEKCLEVAGKGISIQSNNIVFSQMKETSERFMEEIRMAIEQVTDGKHTTKEISFIKSNTQQLIQHKAFKTAIIQLGKLAIARKSKTTNILWIGNYLKDVYFEEEAIENRNLYTKDFFSEILFYYLKACKLFEPEYKVIQEAMKNCD